MTAMCDVAFLLLSFFILATKTKPPEAVQINNPSSVSTKIAKEEAIVVSLTKEGKVYLLLGDKKHKDEIIDKINSNKGLGLTDQELKKLKRQDYVGMPLNKIKGWMAMTEELPASRMDGIPTQDSTNNELVDWIRAVTDAFAGEDINNLNLLVKGDNLAKYPAFKNIKTAFKKNDLYKFKIITNPEGIPADSELAKNAPKAEEKK